MGPWPRETFACFYYKDMSLFDSLAIVLNQALFIIIGCVSGGVEH